MVQKAASQATQVGAAGSQRDSPTPPPSGEALELPNETDVGDEPDAAQESAPPSRAPSCMHKGRRVADVDALSVVIMDKVAAETCEEQAACAKASLGYCGFTLKDAPPMIRWGKINNCPINDKAASNLLNNLETCGLHNTQPDTVI